MQILTIPGSLRAVSLNKSLLRAAMRLAPPRTSIALYDQVGDLPHFNPDLEGPGHEALEPEPVKEFRAVLQQSDAILISSPEYAHGVPGSLKNALDWVVGSGELIGKPIGLLKTSPYSTHAHAALTEILTTMDAHVIAEASLTVPLMGRKLADAEIAADPELAPIIKQSLAALADYISS